MNTGFNKNKDYFESIASKIDRMEHPELYPVVDETYGEVDGNSDIIHIDQVETEPEDAPFQEITDNLPSIDASKINGAISLYNELNRKFGLKFDSNKVNSITENFKAIIDPIDKETFTIYLREYIDRLRLVCLNQLGNTVYSLIDKLTREETLRTLTISEKVALLDRLFEYMEKINNMVGFIPAGDTNSELREISERKQNEGHETKVKGTRNYEMEEFVLNLLRNKRKNDSKN